jgi:putative DNA primase/helicase
VTSAESFAGAIGPAAEALLGEPSARSARELRWGRRGSLAVDLRRGAWFDFETGAGGGVLALVCREGAARTPAEAANWLRAAGLLPGESEPLTRAGLAERAAARKRAQAARAEAERREHLAAADRAIRIWSAAKPASPGHAYLRRKGVEPHAAREHKGLLCLPLVDTARALWSLQFVDADGSKRLLRGGRKAARFIPVHEPPEAERLLLCEGWATGATLAEHEPGALVLAAVDAGNLPAVAVAARRRWPSLSMVICGDADPAGVEAANRAARASGAAVALPEFLPGAVGTDFNDLAAVLAGRGAA